jgi:hypothetical protein
MEMQILRGSDTFAGKATSSNWAGNVVCDVMKRQLTKSDSDIPDTCRDYFSNMLQLNGL